MFKDKIKIPEIIKMDEMVFNSQLKFSQSEISDFFKPKHHFSSHASVHTLRMGPMSGYWCYAYEGFHQRVKRIAKGSKWKNVAKRIVSYFCMQFGVVFGYANSEERRKKSNLC
jgi:hypothetical protein